MSRNGTGVYALPVGNPVVSGTTITSTWANTTLSDISTALTGSIASDGQTPITGNLQMGGNKITGLANGTALTDAATVAQTIEAGTAMLFAQTVAPTGWTKSTTHNNKALRVVSGTASSGGTVAFTTAFSSQNVGSTTLTLDQIPSHNHGNYVAATIAATYNSAGGGGVVDAARAPGLTYLPSDGGGNSHTHTLDIAVQYVDVIIATKD